MKTYIQKQLTRFLVWRYRHINERQFIFGLSIVIGFFAGLVSVTLKNVTHFIQQIFMQENMLATKSQYYFLLPIMGLTLVFLLRKNLIKTEVGHAISTTLYAMSKRNGIIKRVKIYASLVLSPITVGFGGSVGLQGPAIATGAAIGSNLGLLFHLSPQQRKLLIGCATCGAVGAMFKAPITGVIFAIEIFSLDLAFSSLMPLLLASLASIFTSYFFMGSEILFEFKIKDLFHLKDLPYYAILGIATGTASVYFSKMYFFINRLFQPIKTQWKKTLWAGLGISLILFLIPPLYGEGYTIINNLLADNPMKAIGKTPFNVNADQQWLILALLLGIVIFKAVAMTLTFNAGGVGGIFIPTIVMGSTLGYIISGTINQLTGSIQVSSSNFTLLGMTGLLAGVLHAPLTAIFLIAEITGGYELFIPLMLVAVISFVMTKYFVANSIYTHDLAKKGALITHNKDKNVLMMMDVNKVIETNFISLYEEMSLGELLKNAVSKSSRNHFPVINKENQLVGILLLDDIRPMMFDQEMYETTKVFKLMHRPTFIIEYEKDNMEEIMQKFKESGAWNLPVVKGNTYFGFISKSRLLSYYRRKLIEVSQ